MVREFREPSYLRQGAIVYKTSPEQIGFYNYHRWAVDPRQFVTNAVEDRLSASGNYARVARYDRHSDIDCVLAEISRILRKSTAMAILRSTLQSRRRWYGYRPVKRSGRTRFPKLERYEA